MVSFSDMIRNFRAIIDELPIYGRFISAAIQSRMEYRASFFAYVLTLVGFYGAQVAVVGLMLWRFDSMGGWSAGEIALLYSFLVLAQGMVSALFSGLLNFSETVRDGTFDRTLLRPLSPMMQQITLHFEPGGVAHLVIGSVALIFAQSMLSLEWGLAESLFLIAVVTGGGMIFAAVRIVVATIAFFAISNLSLQHLAVFSSREFLLYPVDLYNRPLRFILTFLFPIAFINYYPAHYFLGKDGGELFHPLLVFATFPVGAALLLLSLLFWQFGVKHYGSTGS